VLTALPQTLSLVQGALLLNRRRGEGQGKGEGKAAEGNGRDTPPLSQIHGSAPVDVAVYTALVLVTDCNISVLPARP